MNESPDKEFISGTTYPDRRSLHDAGVHPGSMQAGISPRAESIVLS